MLLLQIQQILVGDQSEFGLSSSDGETVWLEDAFGTLIDSFAFPAMDVTQSYSSFTDGSSIWQLTSTITKGLSNLITSIIDGSISVSEF